MRCWQIIRIAGLQLEIFDDASRASMPVAEGQSSEIQDDMKKLSLFSERANDQSVLNTGMLAQLASSHCQSTLLGTMAEESAPDLADTHPTTRRLVEHGFSVYQLLKFYSVKSKETHNAKDSPMIDKSLLGQPKLHSKTKTDEVVRNIVIPETAKGGSLGSEPCCYMDSDFMARFGGPKRARKLVSHAWAKPFLTTLCNEHCFEHSFVFLVYLRLFRFDAYSFMGAQ